MSMHKRTAERLERLETLGANVERVRTLAAEGVACPQIARRLGITRQRVHRIAKVNDIKLPTAYPETEYRLKIVDAVLAEGGDRAELTRRLLTTHSRSAERRNFNGAWLVVAPTGLRQVYPRLCGGYVARIGATKRSTGTSPPVRGLLWLDRQLLAAARRRRCPIL